MLDRPFIRCLAAALLVLLVQPALGQQAHPQPSTLSMARREFAAGHMAQAATLFRKTQQQPHSIALSAADTLSFATALSATGDNHSALEVLAGGLKRYPTSAPLLDADGALVAQSGDLERAVSLFENAVAQDHNFFSAHYHLGVALLSVGRPEEALPHLENAVASQPDNFDAQLQLGRAFSTLHSDDEGLTHLHRAVELRPATAPPQAIYALALALQASGDAKAALPLFDLVLADPAIADSAALTNAGLAHTQTGDAKGGLALYAKALALGPDTATLREDYGATYLQQAALNDAIVQFQAGLKLEPDNAHLHYDLGLAYKLKDDLPAAVTEFERAGALDSSLPDPAFTLGIIYMQQGRFSESAAHLKQAVALQPQNGDAWALLGSVLKDADDPTGAAEALKHAIALRPDQPSLHIQLATLEAQAGDKEAAAAERKIAADLSRAAINHQRASFALKSGRALLDQNQLNEAVYQLNTAAQADPKSPEPHQLLAEAYTRLGKAEEAKQETQRAQELSRP